MSEARQVDDSNYEGPDRLRLKIPIGKSAVIRCVGKPIAFDDVFEDKESGEKTKKEQYARIVIVRGVDEDPVKGYKYGWQVFKQLRALAQKATWGDLTGYDVEIENTGTLPDYWKVTPVEKSPLTQAERDMVLAANTDLGVLFLGKKKEDDDPYAD